MLEQPDNWQETQKILVILAHPDDPEFFCGATLARWARSGHEIHYLILTCGDKGGKTELTSSQLTKKRRAEQQAAGKVIGVRTVRFLGIEDGYLLPSLELRREIVRSVRQVRPDILVTCDPTYLYAGDWYLNHPDHRYTGQVVLDAVFPAAGNGHFFPELMIDEHLEPHSPRELWISLTGNPNVELDVTDNWETKIRALKKHRSQIGDPKEFEKRMRARKSDKSTEEKVIYEEKFRVIRNRR